MTKIWSLSFSFHLLHCIVYLSMHSILQKENFDHSFAFFLSRTILLNSNSAHFWIFTNPLMIAHRKVNLKNQKLLIFNSMLLNVAKLDKLLNIQGWNWPAKKHKILIFGLLTNIFICKSSKAVAISWTLVIWDYLQ